MSLTLPQNEAMPTIQSLGQKCLIANFLANQDVKKTSIELYGKTLRQFFLWMDKKRFVLWESDRSTILNYKEDLLKSNLSTLTVGSYLVVVRKFYQWTEEEKLYPNVARGVKTPRRSYKGFKKLPLEKESARELLLSLDTTTLGGKRDFAIINLLLRTGLRTLELIRADIGDITQRYGQIILKVHGKGCDDKEDQYVVLTEKCLKPIRAYLKASGAQDPTSPLFCTLSRNNKQSGRLSTRFIRNLVKEQLRSIGLDTPQHSAHSLRHTAAVLVIESGEDLHSTQIFMRHSSPETTQIYLRTVEEKLRLSNPAGKRLDTII